MKTLAWFGLLIAVVTLGPLAITRTSFSATCARCLQHARGSETKVLGLVVRHEQTPTQRHGGLMSPDIFGPPIPTDPALYETIMGQPCDHAFKRGGQCRTSGGVIACGASAEGMRFTFRNRLVARVYETFCELQTPNMPARRLLCLRKGFQPAGPPRSFSSPTMGPCNSSILKIR